MTPRPPLLLQLLPLALLLLAIALPGASASSTLAVSASSTSPTVCGVDAYNGTVYCAALPGSSSNNASSASFPVAQSIITFAEVSAGRGFVCGLQAGGAALFCWPSTPAPQWGQLRRLYNGPSPLADLAVGGDHVAAYEANASASDSGRVLWWRGGDRFPAQADGGFRSLVSGDGFTCAVETNASAAVRCWGPQGSPVQAGLANATAAPYLAAGGARACTVLASGSALCSGSDDVGAAANASAAGALPMDLFGYGLAVGDSHACALRRPNHTAVCWSLGGPTTTLYEPALGISFLFLAAAGNFTCGVASIDYSVYCWSAGADAAPVPLPKIRPGVCVSNVSACRRGCGFMPGSQQLCGGSSGICDALVCDASPPTPAPPPAPSPSSGRRVSKAWIAFCVVGAVGGFAGLCSIVYCLVFGFCSNKRVHNSVQPNITTTAAGADTNNGGGGAAAGGSPYGSPNGSRARSLFRRQLSRVMTRQRSGPSSFKDPAEEFTFAQLEAATKGFALEAKIGEGSFGTVYRGKLPDGREVAIKRACESGPRARRFQEKESAFRSELAFLSRLHHKHLVGLVGYCEENEERLLVYEYMKNGALYDHLHPKPGAAPSPVASSWKLRIKILLDASRGIEYLHSYAVPPIIHRDIKSSNILLDGGWTARVSDFGLSLMGPLEPSSEDDDASATAAAATRSRSRSRSRSQSQHLTVMKAAGTVGYMDPEYYGLHHLTVKSDVYGFGVVMVESLTGRRAIFKEAEGGSPVSVVDYAVPSIVGGELMKVLDPRAPEPAAHEAEAVELVAYTAVHCVRLEGKDRPAMADIVANLETAFALCEGSAGGGDRGGGGFGNSSSSASLPSVTSMDRSGAL
ncbi:putative serine/threonine-protein kinase-like protein CCR3 [Miscanthus floridulus]|uniref:putative serine/threonine-protein kinase-like protein CCR3 n=1 Tax=Miscanthus floridulus TaxID=154761 RepID=UPI0034593FBC